MAEDLEDYINVEVLRRNDAWLRQLFRSHDGLRTRLRVARQSQGHVYTIRNPVLNTRLGEHTPAQAATGRLCGDHGGRTAKGTPCRRRGVDPAGRCRQHPHTTVVPRLNPGERLEWVAIEFGDDAAFRPIGGGVPWTKCRMTVPDSDTVLVAIDRLDDPPLALATCTRVWAEQIFRIRSLLKAPYEAALLLEAGKELPVEPMWTTDMLWARHPELAGCTINGRPAAAGALLQDYGVVPGATVPVQKKPV